MDHETKKKQLQKIEGACDFKFAELKEGQAFGLDGERIPDKHVIPHHLQKVDGLYRLVKHTCDGDNCSIGKPNQDCIDRGIMVDTECGRYGVWE